MNFPRANLSHSSFLCYSDVLFPVPAFNFTSLRGQMAAVTRTAPRKMGLVVAMDLDGGIAKGGKIPWSLRKDMAFFKQITSTTSDKSKVAFFF